MSNYTKATNFAIKDSLVTTDPAKIIKGTDIDNEYNAISSAIASKADVNSPSLTGVPTAPTATAGTNTTQIATTAFATAAALAAFPSGGIIMWSGSIISIPTGWLICDGTNSTPDLRNRFVVGAGSTYAVGATGGSADAVVVSHTHTATVTDPGHTHGLTPTATYLTTSGGNSVPTGTGRGFETISVVSATTGITVANSTTGVSGTNANLPPYYSLAFIMKV